MPVQHQRRECIAKSIKNHKTCATLIQADKSLAAFALPTVTPAKPLIPDGSAT
jgi:hypothetical protein